MSGRASDMLNRGLFLGLLVAAVVLVAQIGDRWHTEIDLSARQIHSLSEAAAQALDKIGSELEILAFVPDYPVQRAETRQLLAPYTKHASQPRLRFIDPVREPERAREHGVGRQGEVHLLAGPRREVLRTLSSATIDRALNRLALSGQRWIVSLKGQGEPELDGSTAGLGRFADHAEQLGYRVISLDPRQMTQLPANTAVLLIANPPDTYDPRTQSLIAEYLRHAGRMIWLSNRALPGDLEESLGVRSLPGVLVDAAAARYGLDSPANAIVSAYPPELLPQPPAQYSVLPLARAFQIEPRPDWTLVAALQTGAQSWNETDDLRGRIARDPLAGELAGPHKVVLALEKDSGELPSRVILVGSQHLISNGLIGQAGNRELALGLLHWLSDNSQLATVTSQPDLEIRWSAPFGAGLAIILMAGLPLAYLATGLWLRRRRRRQ